MIVITVEHRIVYELDLLFLGTIRLSFPVDLIIILHSLPIAKRRWIRPLNLTHKFLHQVFSKPIMRVPELKLVRIPVLTEFIRRLFFIKRVTNALYNFLILNAVRRLFLFWLVHGISLHFYVFFDLIVMLVIFLLITSYFVFEKLSIC